MLRRGVLAVLAVIGAQLGCVSEPENCRVLWSSEPELEPRYPEPTVCDPLDMPETPILLQPPIAVAREEAGTMLVIDRLDGGAGRPGVDEELPSRLFRGDADGLVQLEGSAWTSSQDEDHVHVSFSTADAATSGFVRVDGPDMPPNVVPSETAMVVFEEPPDLTSPHSFFHEGTRLQVRSECEAANLSLRPLARRREVEYLAEDDAGNRVLVARPEVDWDVQSATLFYGPPDAVLQRPVLAFGRKRDGGTTDIYFDYEGQEARLHFPVGCNGMFSLDCEGELHLPDGMRTVSIPQRTVPVPEGETYVCVDG